MSAAANDLLQDFLNRGLLNIGADDVRLGYFREAAKSLADSWLNDQQKIIPAVLAALDPDVESADGTIRESEEALQSKWNTYRNAYPDSPRQFLRAIALEALRQVGQQSTECGGAIWLAGKSVVAYHDLRLEREVVEAVLRGLGDSHETAAQKLWTTRPTNSAEVKLPRLTVPKLDVKALTERIAAASGPHDAQGTAYKDPRNPHWSNSSPHWSHSFPAIAANGIADATNAVASALMGNVTTGLKEFAGAVGSALETAEAQTGASGSLGKMRLLWWRQAMYSPAAECGYRELAPLTAAALMAADLADETTAQTPTSVEYLLREAVREIAINDELRTNLNLRGAVTCATTGEGGAALRYALEKHVTGAQPERRHRLPLVEVLAQTAQSGELEEGSLQAALGVKESSATTIADFAVWLFRDIQAKRLLKIGKVDKDVSA